MSKLTEIKEAVKETERKLKDNPESTKVNEVYHWIVYLISLLEEKDKAIEETVTLLEEMVDEMAFLKSEFNVGDVLGTGLFSDADAIIDRAGDIIIKRSIARKALNTSSNSEGE